MQQFDFKSLLHIGLGQLKLTPEVFWDCTPAELMLLMGQDPSSQPMTRDGLAALMAAYPDVQKETENG